LRVVASGVVAPTGLGVERISTSLSAGICRYRRSDFHARDGDEIRLASVPSDVLNGLIRTSRLRGELTAYQRRLLRLAVSALGNLKSSLPAAPLPVFLAGPELYLGERGLDTTFIDNLGHQCEVAFQLHNSRVVNIGRAGVIALLETVSRFFEATGEDYALVGGVDSFYSAPILTMLESRSRLAVSGNTGFIPGEAAGFLLVSNIAKSDAPSACLSTPFIAYEQGHILGDDVYRGEALGQVVGAALGNTNVKNGFLYSSVNGEAHYDKELAVALTRNRDQLPDTPVIFRPAESFGDIGAAYGAVTLALASLRLAKQGNDGGSLIYGSSDSGTRAAVGIGLC